MSALPGASSSAVSYQQIFKNINATLRMLRITAGIEGNSEQKRGFHIQLMTEHNSFLVSSYLLSATQGLSSS